MRVSNSFSRRVRSMVAGDLLRRRADEGRGVGKMQKAIYDKYPTITVINMADVLEIIQSVVDQISMVVRFISGSRCWRAR